MLSIERFICGPLENNAYLLVNPDTKCCAVVDCPPEPGSIHTYISEQELKVSAILLTHAHFDHAHSLADFKRRYGASVHVHPAETQWLSRLVATATHWGVLGAEDAPEPDVLLEHGQLLDICGTEVEVRHTPGHSPGQVAFVLPGHVLVGDTLFWRSIGRYDLPGSDFEALQRSVEEQLYTLPAETVVWPGHGNETTIGEEYRLNPYFGEGARFKPTL